jgi:hypothetical protein
MPLLVLLCCWLALAPAWAQEQADPAVLRAQLHQELLPALSARTQAAQARTAAAERWFAGQGAWTEAFSGLAGAPVGDPGFLKAHAWQLQGRAQQRASELSAPHPSGLEAAGPPLLDPWRSALGDACAAEERADLLEQRFVAGLQAGLERAPGLADSAVAPVLEGWAQQRVAAQVEHPSAEQLSLASAAGQAAGELEQLRQLAWRAATVPGDGALAAAVEAQLEPLPDGGDTAQALLQAAQADRLERVAPLLAGPLAQRVAQLVDDGERRSLAAEKARLEASLAAEAELEAQLEALPVDQLEAQISELHGALDQARHELGSELHEAGEDGLHQEVAQLRVWLDEKRLAARQAALDRARRVAVTGLGHEGDDAKLAEARREADLAQQQADEQAELASQAEATLRTQVAELRREIAELVEAEAGRRDASVTGVEVLGERLEAHTDGLVTALALPPLDPERQLRIDETYLGLRAVVDDLRRELGARVAELEALLVDGAQRRAKPELEPFAVDPGVRHEAVRELLGQALEAQADLEAALADRERAAGDEVDAVLALLVRAKNQRRRARPEASVQARREVSRAFLPELVAELAELPVRLVSNGRHAGPWLRSLPAQLLDLSAIWLLLAGSVELLLLALVWLWLRRAAPGWVRNLVLQAHAAGRDRDARGLARWLALQAQRWLEPGDLARLAAPWGALTLAVVDALASWQLARFLADAPAIIALLAWGFAAVVLWRALPAIVPALLATREDERPALRVLTTSTIALVRWSLRLMLGWWLALVLCQLAALRLLEADRLLELVNVLGTIAFWVLVVLLLQRWSPALVRALGEQPDSRLVRWAARESSSWVLQTLQGATALALLLGQQVAHWGSRLSGRGPRMSWLAALVARRQLRDSSEREGEPLPAELRQRFEALRPPLPGVEQVQQQLEEAFAAWLQQRRRGLHVVTGDRGMGRSTLLDRVARSLGGEHKVLSIGPEQRVDGPEGARAWLAAAVLGRVGGSPPSRQELIDEISLLPGPRVFLVDEMEWFFLREVGGFAALRVVLQTLHATSDEHFWICGFHGPTWSYLRGVPGVFDPAYFERIHALPSVGPEAMGRWLRTAAQQAELELSFDDLAGIGPNTLEAGRLRTRAQAAYWRLLADSSAGNPLVARCLWLDGARIEGDRLRVGLSDAPVAAQLQDLSDNELFVLTAVVVHDQLAVLQLARALNLPRSGVRTACQRLVARGVLSSDGFEDSSTYRLELHWLPAVERHLRNKNFLARS